MDTRSQKANVALHFHLLASKYSDSGEVKRPRLAMTMFWPDLGGNPEPVIVLLGIDKDIGGIRYRKFPRLGEENAGLRTLALLLLRHFSAGSVRPWLGSDHVDSLKDVARRPNDKDHPNDPTWLQSIFDVPVGQQITKERSDLLEFETSNITAVRVGNGLLEADFAVFVHETEAQVLAELPAAEIRSKLGPGGRLRASAQINSTSNAENKLNYTRLADLLEGELKVTCKVEAQKHSFGQWRDVEDEPELLPLTDHDVFRLRIRSSPKGHIYVVWIGSDGKVMPLYPWLPHQGWKNHDAARRDMPISELLITDDYQDILPSNLCRLRSTGNPGAETIVIVGHRTPLSHLSLERFVDKSVMPLSSVKGIPFRDARRLERLQIARVTTGTETNSVEKPRPTSRSIGLAPKESSTVLSTLQSNLERSLAFRVDTCLMLVIPSLASDAHVSFSTTSPQ